MKKIGMAYRLLALVAAVAFLASCSAPSAKPKETSARMTPVSSPALTAIAGTQPTPTDTLPPKGLQHPLPAVMPASTEKPADTHLDANDYYIESRNGRGGVVDKNGKVVLPFRYVSISEVSATDSDPDSSAYTHYTGEPIFFTVPVQEGPANAKRRYSGYLYDADGRMVTSARLYTAQAVGPDVIQIEKALPGDYITDESSDYDYYQESGVTGAILFSGRLIVPYEYDGISQFGKTVAAEKSGENGGCTVDFYDLKGKLLTSMPAFAGNDGSLAGLETYDNLLAFQAPDGKYGLLNDQLQWVTPTQWDFVEYDEQTGQFIVTKDGLVGVMDDSGHIVITPAYNPAYGGSNSFYNYTTDKYYSLVDDAGGHLLDSSGKELMHSDQYNRYIYSNGVVIAQMAQVSADGFSAARSDLYDLQGNLLISILDDIKEYLPNEGYFACPTKVYDTKGDALPLPDNVGVQFLTADRFIVTAQIQNSDENDTDGTGGMIYNPVGLCDAQGKWIIQPQYMDLQSLGGNVIRYGVEDDDIEQGEMYGLMDMDGHILTGPVFYNFSIYNGDLYDVETDTMSGLMDSNLHWVWKTSTYDTLDD